MIRRRARDRNETGRAVREKVAIIEGLTQLLRDPTIGSDCRLVRPALAAIERQVQSLKELVLGET